MDSRDTSSRQTDGLSTDQVEQFYEEGYLGPLRACPPVEAAEFIERVEAEVLNTDDYPFSHTDAGPRHDRHRDSRLVYDFITQPSIIEKISSLYGPNLLLWTSHLWEKKSGEAGVPWHQEQHFSAIEPPVTATLDLALDPYDVEAGCFQVIPGSHESYIPHGEASGAESQGMAGPEHVDDERAVTVELDAGEFLVYNSRLLHRTLNNDTGRSRRTISCRITTPLVKILTSSPLIHEEHKSIVVKGNDWHGINETVEPPK